MRPRGLIDTGAILGLINAEDPWHRRCAEAFSSLPLPLATSAAILAELFHLIGPRPRAYAAAWDLLRSEAIQVLTIDDHDLPAIEAMMEKYRDRPMDFADATLVHLARRENLTTVFTVDRADFETYRIDGRRRFRIVPG